MARNTDAHDPAPRTHRCPVKGCRVANLSPSVLMCAAHWRMVPYRIKLDVLTCWNDGQPYSRYPAVRDTAIAAVNAQLARR